MSGARKTFRWKAQEKSQLILSILESLAIAYEILMLDKNLRWKRGRERMAELKAKRGYAYVYMIGREKGSVKRLKSG